MDQGGKWALAPAFDMTFNYNPNGKWTHSHQLSVMGKNQEIGRDDLLKVGDLFGVKRAKAILAQVIEGVATWPKAAEQAGVDKDRIAAVTKLLKVDALGSPTPGKRLSQ
jgi:serine/threonine-protein kinase HipA